MRHRGRRGSPAHSAHSAAAAHPTVALALCLLVLAAGLAVITVSQQVWQLLVGTAVLGAGIPLLIVAYNTILQKRTPGHLMGRVSTTTEVLTTTPQALSIALGALRGRMVLPVPERRGRSTSR